MSDKRLSKRMLNTSLADKIYKDMSSTKNKLI